MPRKLRWGGGCRLYRQGLGSWDQVARLPMGALVHLEDDSRSVLRLSAVIYPGLRYGVSSRRNIIPRHIGLDLELE